MELFSTSIIATIAMVFFTLGLVCLARGKGDVRWFGGCILFVSIALVFQIAFAHIALAPVIDTITSH